MNARMRKGVVRRSSTSIFTSICVAVFASAFAGSAIGAVLPLGTAYTTEGWVSTQANQTPIQFVNVSNGVANGTNQINLGGFRVSQAPGATTTYNNAPFVINFFAPSYDKTVTNSSTPGDFTVSEGSFSVTGFLNGTLNADGSSNVVATFNPSAGGALIPRLTAGTYVNGLPFELADVKIPSTMDLSQGAHDSGYDAGRFGVTVTIVPEPASLAVFFAGIAAIALKGRKLRRRQSGSPCA